MKYKANTVEDYIDQLPEERKEAVIELRKVIQNNLPVGFVEGMGYGMPAYFVSKEIYPKGYHCDPELPLPFINIASQKNFIALYHMGIYGMPNLLKWFQHEYPKYAKTKLVMGKSCIRFKKISDIPYKLIGELVAKVTVAEWIEVYEQQLDKGKKSNN